MFKYDLITHIFINFDQLNHVSFIPMLTPDSETNDGKKIDYSKATAGNLNICLANFLNNCVSNNKRDLNEIVKYFHQMQIPFCLYNTDAFFKHETRNEYFGQIQKSLLNNSLIFIDPDNGMEIQKTKEKHIFYQEILSLYQQMSNKSLLMVFQFLPYEKRKSYIEKRVADLEKILGATPQVIRDNQLAFFIITKEMNTASHLHEALITYAQRYPKLVIG